MIRYALTLVASVLVGSSVAGASVVPRGSHGLNHGWMARDANPKHPWLYVAGFSNNVVNIYDQQRYGTPLIGSLTQGMNNPCGLALDPQGTLYVTNDGANTVEIFPAGATAPSL